MAGLNDLLFRVGLTGGVGSGKTTVANLLAELGASVIDTDAIARALTVRGGPAMPAIVDHFGPWVLGADGALDRGAMRARVFSDTKARRDLEAILHPMIRTESIQLCATAQGIYVVLVVPLLVESLPEYRPLLDRIAVVDCDLEQQVARTAKRPGLDEAQARSVVAAQVDRSARFAIADDVIQNGTDFADLKARVEQLHTSYTKLAAEKSALKENY